jgi:hypothetical protein
MTDWRAFIEQIRVSPKFADAASKSAVWDASVNDIARALDHYSHADDPKEIELFDKLSVTIDDEGSSVKLRLLAIVSILSDFKYGKNGRN